MAEVRLKEENANVTASVLNGEIVGFMTVQYIVKPMGPYSYERRFYRIEELCGRKPSPSGHRHGDDWLCEKGRGGVTVIQPP